MLLIPKRHGQTDGRTDGRLTVALPRSALASRGKNLTGYFIGVNFASDSVVFLRHWALYKFTYLLTYFDAVFCVYCCRWFIVNFHLSTGLRPTLVALSWLHGRDSPATISQPAYATPYPSFHISRWTNDSVCIICMSCQKLVYTFWRSLFTHTHTSRSHLSVVPPELPVGT